MLRKITLGLIAFFLASGAAEAASRVWISEYGTQAIVAGGSRADIAPLPALVLQSTLDLSGGTAQTSAAFGGQTKFIRVVCEVQCAVRGDGTAATTSAILLPALSAEYFGVQPGATISVIAAP